VAFLGLSVKNLGGEGLMGEGAVRLHIEDCYTENVNHAINTYSESTYVSIRRNYVSTAEIILACISLALRWASASARTFSVAPVLSTRSLTQPLLPTAPPQLALHLRRGRQQRRDRRKYVRPAGGL